MADEQTISLYEHIPLEDAAVSPLERSSSSSYNNHHNQTSNSYSNWLIGLFGEADDSDTPDEPSYNEKLALRSIFGILIFMMLFSIINYAATNHTNNHTIALRPTSDENGYSPSCNPSKVILSIQYACGNPTIHGLWLDPEDSCEFCNTSPFSLENINNETKSSMEIFWPNCYGGTSDDVSFWEHEWSKHGSCSGMTQENYFSFTLSLFEQYRDNCPQTLNTECRLCWDGNLESYEGLCS